MVSDMETQGWTYVRGALSPETVQGFCNQIWATIPSTFAGAVADDPSTWPSAHEAATSAHCRGSLFVSPDDPLMGKPKAALAPASGKGSPQTTKAKGAKGAKGATRTAQGSPRTGKAKHISGLGTKGSPKAKVKPGSLDVSREHWKHLFKGEALKTAVTSYSQSLGFRSWDCPLNVGRTASHHWYPIAFPDPTAPHAVQPCNGTGMKDVGQVLLLLLLAPYTQRCKRSTCFHCHTLTEIRINPF